VTSHLLAFSMPGGIEWIIILAIGLLIFGKRLPEVGRSLGRGIVEFKKGVKGIEEELEQASSEPEKPREPAKLETPRDESGEDLRVSRSEPTAPQSAPQSGA
jgi:sec-independent protein translocase protein TatA